MLNRCFFNGNLEFWFMPGRARLRDQVPVKPWTLRLYGASWTVTLLACCFGKSVFCVTPHGRDSMDSSRLHVPVNWGCYNEMPQTGRIKQHSFPTILEAGNTRSRCRQTGSAPGEGPLPGLQMATFSMCPPMAERGSSSFFS